MLSGPFDCLTRYFAFRSNRVGLKLGYAKIGSSPVDWRIPTLATVNIIFDLKKQHTTEKIKA